MAQTIEDALQAEMTRHAAYAMGEWLINAPGVLDKKVRFLSIAELDALAVACISAYVTIRQKLSDAPPSSEPEASSFTA